MIFKIFQTKSREIFLNLIENQKSTADIILENKILEAFPLISEIRLGCLYHLILHSILYLLCTGGGGVPNQCCKTRRKRYRSWKRLII